MPESPIREREIDKYQLPEQSYIFTKKRESQDTVINEKSVTSVTSLRKMTCLSLMVDFLVTHQLASHFSIHRENATPKHFLK